MLSFIYQLAHTYEQEHGHAPNLLVLNRRHYAALRADLPEDALQGTLTKRLGMEIMLADDVTHPHVAWTQRLWQQASG